MKFSVKNSSDTPIRQSQGSWTFTCWTHFPACCSLRFASRFCFQWPDCLKFDTQTWIVFLSGTRLCCPRSNRIRNAQWSSIYAILHTENGTYSSFKYYFLHISTSTTTYTAVSWNTTSFFAGPCIMPPIFLTVHSNKYS